VAHYREVAEMIKSYFPKAGIGADVIVGFPGETEEQFQNTYRLMEELPITHFHVFPFSSRKGTLAAKMENHIQYSVRKERVKILNELGLRKLINLAKSMENLEVEVLFEIKNPQGYWEAYTSNYVRVLVKSDELLRNECRKVKLQNVQEDGSILGILC
jgi:threonylcarbamoyladenosine tRNA methylthiotransferase MtaB